MYMLSEETYTGFFQGGLTRQARPDLDGSTHHSIDRESVESDRKEEISSAQISMLFPCAMMRMALICPTLLSVD